METATKQCRKCGESKPTEEFYKSRNRDGLSSWCRKCTIAAAAEKKRQYRAEGRYDEKERTYKRAYFQRKYHDPILGPAFKEAEKARKRQWAIDNPEVARAYFLNRKNKRSYGMTTDQVLAMIEAQDGRCAACGREFSVSVQNNGPLCPNVDHDHDTGRVRGILCGSCNLAAGGLGDDWRRVELLAAYLKRHSDEDMVRSSV